MVLSLLFNVDISEITFDISFEKFLKFSFIKSPNIQLRVIPASEIVLRPFLLNNVKLFLNAIRFSED